MGTGGSLVIERGPLEGFLESTEVADFHDPRVVAKLAEFREAAPSVETQAAAAFRYVRDGIRHSFDSQEPLVTISSCDVLAAGTGICFAKSHLLAALLRGLGVPTGFCSEKQAGRRRAAHADARPGPPGAGAPPPAGYEAGVRVTSYPRVSKRFTAWRRTRSWSRRSK